MDTIDALFEYAEAALLLQLPENHLGLSMKELIDSFALFKAYPGNQRIDRNNTNIVTLSEAGLQSNELIHLRFLLSS